MKPHLSALYFLLTFTFVFFVLSLFPYILFSFSEYTINMKNWTTITRTKFITMEFCAFWIVLIGSGIAYLVLSLIEAKEKEAQNIEIRIK